MELRLLALHSGEQVGQQCPSAVVGCVMLEVEVGPSACSLLLALDPSLASSRRWLNRAFQVLHCTLPADTSELGDGQCASCTGVFHVKCSVWARSCSPSRVFLHITVGAVDSFIFDGESREGPLHVAAAAITAPP